MASSLVCSHLATVIKEAVLSRRSFPCTSIWSTFNIHIFVWEALWPHVCVLSSRSGGRGHYVVFLGKTLYSHGASLYPGIQMGTGEYHAGDNPGMD